MEFVDETRVTVRSGRGGDGAVSFRRERNMPLGGPTGGDGGNGGSVSFVADENADTLLPIAKTQRYAAASGEPGKGNNRHGASAPDIVATVPVGTVFYEQDRLVADLVRGKPVDQALNILAFSPKKGAGIVKKVLESAIANAEHNDGADIDELTVKTICVEKGMVLKRFTARAKGRGNRISKPTCHIYLTVGN